MGSNCGKGKSHIGNSYLFPHENGVGKPPLKFFLLACFDKLPGRAWDFREVRQC